MRAPARIYASETTMDAGVHRLDIFRKVVPLRPIGNIKG
jgi:hypothetical protein